MSDSARGRLRGILSAPLEGFAPQQGCSPSMRASGVIRQSSRLSGQSAAARLLHHCLQRCAAASEYKQVSNCWPDFISRHDCCCEQCPGNFAAACTLNKKINGFCDISLHVGCCNHTSSNLLLMMCCLLGRLQPNSVLGCCCTLLLDPTVVHSSSF